MSLPLLYIIIPCYNEEAVLPLTAPLFKAERDELIAKGKIAPTSRILFVDDGSVDRTWEIISNLAKSDPCFCGIRQSRNRGHQNALVAGLMEVKDRCDITITVDCDGQDDIAAMEKMVDAYTAGAEIVYGVRDDRKSDSFFKRHTAQHFYRWMKRLGGEVVYNHADYRLVGRRALAAFADFEEVHLFLRGMFPLVGFNSTTVTYTRTGRLAGKSKYPFRKSVALAVDGITGLSVKPLRWITLLGVLVSIFSVVGIIWTLIRHFLGQTVAGWSSLTCILCFVSGVQLLSLGVIGEYIGKIFTQVKNRPRYIISERTDEEQ